MLTPRLVGTIGARTDFLAGTPSDGVPTPVPPFTPNESGREEKSPEAHPPSRPEVAPLETITEADRCPLLFRPVVIYDMPLVAPDKERESLRTPSGRLQHSGSQENAQASTLLICPTEGRVVTTSLPGGLFALFQTPGSRMVKQASLTKLTGATEKHLHKLGRRRARKAHRPQPKVLRFL